MMRFVLLLGAVLLPTVAFAADVDGDGFDSARDCDDTDATIHPGAPEVCDGLDNDCDGLVDNGCGGDVDADGYTTAQGDCDDTNPRVNPGAQEVCDRANTDEDCDGTADDADASATGQVNFYADSDADGFGDPGLAHGACDPSFLYSVTSGTDCDDADDTTFPGAPEACDGVDNDCDGLVDDGCGAGDRDGDGYTAAQGDCDDRDPAVNPSMVEIVGNGVDEDCDGVHTCFVDDDDDGVAVDAHATVASSDSDCYDSGEASATDPTDDCDDAVDTTYPNAPELCDSVDNDCNGIVDDGCTGDDADRDGFTEDGGDCDDGDPTVNPRANETCDGVDNDCDGVVDNGCGSDDADADGYTVADGDCDDTDATVNPGAVENVANGRDDDCDGEVDEGAVSDTGDSGDTDPVTVSRVGCAGRGSGMSYGAALLPLLALLRLRRRG